MTKPIYDFIILGAGTSACYFAEQVSRNNSSRVLIIEAGVMSKNPIFAMPVGFTQTLFNQKYNWCFRSTPELQLNGRTIFCPRGKIVGGSSMLNGMIHAIGQAEDYDTWMNVGFTLSNTTQLMAKFNELFPVQEAITRAQTHPLESIFASACREMNIEFTDTLHDSASRVCAGTYYHTIKAGRRHAVRGLIPILKSRPNVTFLTRTQIDKLFFENGTVRQIRVLSDKNTTVDIPVSGEVIICLGALGSPALLQRSGIGPSKLLSDLGIDSVVDLPTGENLQDHLLTKRTYRLNNLKTLNSDAQGTRIAHCLWDYLANRRGPLCSGASSAGAYLSLMSEQRPDTQLFFSYGSASETAKALVADPFDAITIGTYQLRPESRGSVMITSKDPRAPPQLHYNYLSTATDWQAARAGMRFQETMMQRKAFSSFTPTGAHGELSDDDFIRQHADTAHHPVGTCALGEKGVVDGNLKVHGMKNLTIADASVIPKIISGNTQAICAVIGDLLGEHLMNRSHYV